jgi:hypothetical protein
MPDGTTNSPSSSSGLATGDSDGESVKARCAPSRNLNVSYPSFAAAREMYDHLREITKPVRSKTRGGDFLRLFASLPDMARSLKSVL